MDFDSPAFYLSLFFGLVGFSAWRYGRRVSSERHLILAVLLMSYGYFMSNAWISLFLGASLTVLLFWP